MQEAIDNNRNVTLFAIRRMGKTALIEHFFYQLDQKRYECLYVDAMPTNSIEDFTQRLANAIVQKLGSPQRGISRNIQHLLSSVGATINFDQLTGLPEG